MDIYYWFFPEETLFNQISVLQASLERAKRVDSSLRVCAQIQKKIQEFHLQSQQTSFLSTQKVQEMVLVSDIQRKVAEKIAALQGKKVEVSIEPSMKESFQASLVYAKKPLSKSLQEKLPQYAMIRDNVGQGACFYLSLAVGLGEWLFLQKGHPEQLRQTVLAAEGILEKTKNDLIEVIEKSKSCLPGDVEAFVTNEPWIRPAVQFFKEAAAEKIKNSYDWNCDEQRALFQAAARADGSRSIKTMEEYLQKEVLAWRAFATDLVIANLANVLPIPFCIAGISEQGMMSRVFPDNGQNPQIHLINLGIHYVLAYPKDESS